MDTRLILGLVVNDRQMRRRWEGDLLRLECEEYVTRFES